MVVLTTYGVKRLREDESECQSGIDKNGTREIAAFWLMPLLAKLGVQRARRVFAHELSHQHDGIKDNKVEQVNGGHHPKEHGCIRVPRCWSDSKTWTHTPISDVIVTRFLRDKQIPDDVLAALPNQ